MENLDRPYLRCKWLIHTVVLFGTIALSVSNDCETLNDVWTKVFETGANGSVVMGNQTELNAAVMTGARVRFVIAGWGEAGYVGDFEAVRILTPGSVVLCGQSPMRISKNGWGKFLEDAYWSFIFVCTSGNTYQSHYDVGSNTFKSDNTSVNAVQWFIRKPVSQISLLYRLEDGTTVSGSDAAVRNAVLSGYDMTTDYLNLIPFFHSNVDISATGVVVGQSIKKQITSNFADLYLFFTMWSTDGFTEASIWSINGSIHKWDNTFRYDQSWFADPCWREVYTHDENGNPQTGSVDHLVSAVESGHRVKIVVGNLSVQVDNVRAKGGHVSAQLLDQLSKKDTHTFEEDPFWIWQMAHTTGTLLTRRYFISNFTNAGDTAETKAISWFIDTHTWVKVLSTKSDGCVKSGSKTELTDAIKNGAAVRVALKFGGRERTRRGRGRGRGAVRGWFVMDATNLELSSSGEVAAQLIKAVSTEGAGRDEFRITDDPSWSFKLVTTQGDVLVSLWKVGQHVNDGRFSEKADVNWFVSY